MCGCIYGLVRSHTVSQGLVRSLIRLYMDMAPVSVFLKVLKIIHGFHGYTETRIRPRLVRLYVHFVRFTRMANRISRVFCVRQALNISFGLISFILFKLVDFVLF